MPWLEPPSAAAFNNYRVTNRNFSELVYQPLYDWQLMPAGGAQVLNFFQLPQGQGVTSSLGATVGTSKTLNDTNMTVGGMLPSGMEFLIESIEVPFLPGSVSTANTYTPAQFLNFNATAAATVGAPWFNDVNTFYQGGRLEFTVLAKKFLIDSPLYKFIPKVQFMVDAAIASNSATTGEIIAGKTGLAGPLYELRPPISLQPTANFSIDLVWPAVVAMPSGFIGRVGVTLQGYTLRAGQ